jgi:carbamoyltransferase
MSSIYGLFGGSHDPSVCLIIDGKIQFCVEEERMNRIKSGDNHPEVPRLALRRIEKESNLTVKESDYVVFSEHVPIPFAQRLERDYTSYNHHLCHAASVYYTSGIQEKCLILSMDAGGNNDSVHLYTAENGEMTKVFSDYYPKDGNLAIVWAYATRSAKGLNKDGKFIWNLCKDEGKLMGMAPDGEYDEKFDKFFKNLIDYNNWSFFPSNTLGRTRFATEKIRRLGWLDTTKQLSDFSFALQKKTEELMLKFLGDIHEKYPDYRKICLAGGIFANVKLNQKINQLDWVDEIYVVPAMGDNGLSLGAAILKTRELGEGFLLPEKLDNVYFGFEYTFEELKKCVQGKPIHIEMFDAKKVANYINDGEIIGWFQGRMEYGARSLGSRSILCKPNDLEVKNKLNKILQRNDTMPFAPVVMEEYFDDIFTESKSKYSAKFMTICYDTKQEWMDKIPSVVQKSDGTARPQIIEKKTNENYWRVIDEFRKLTEIPLLLNTSFNVHNEPIIEEPCRAVTHLVNGIIDKLVFENYVLQFRQP